MMNGPEIEPTDRELVARVAESGDEDAFRQLYRRHTPGLFRFVAAGAGRSAAEDLTQEVWVRAVKGLRRFRGESAFKTWLFGIAVNCCREFVRGREWERRVAVRTEGEEPAVASQRVEGSLDLERALETLPPGRLQVFLLHDLEGYTHEEISGILDIDVGTSKSQLFKARAALRDFLGASRKPEKGAM
jgi:RNA polymerase sigma-70 factor (ECF subfamily)